MEIQLAGLALAMETSARIKESLNDNFETEDEFEFARILYKIKKAKKRRGLEEKKEKTKTKNMSVLEELLQREPLFSKRKVKRKSIKPFDFY